MQSCGLCTAQSHLSQWAGRGWEAACILLFNLCPWLGAICLEGIHFSNSHRSLDQFYLNQFLLLPRSVSYLQQEKCSIEMTSIAPPFPGGSVVKNPPANVRAIRDTGSIPGSGRSPWGGNGNPLQHSCLGNPMDRGALWATIRGVTKSWTWLSTHSCRAPHSYEILTWQQITQWAHEGAIPSPLGRRQLLEAFQAGFLGLNPQWSAPSYS